MGRADETGPDAGGSATGKNGPGRDGGPRRDLASGPGAAGRPTDRGTPWDLPGDGDRTGPSESGPAVTTETGDGPRFAGARRRALLWNAGWVVVAGAVLLLLWGTNRPIDGLPDTVTLVAGILSLVWAGILVGIASGGVGRTPTAIVGVVNVVVGLVGFTVGWINEDVSVVVLILAAQVAALGVVQWTTTIRR
jgi:hypothetical protein